MKTIDNIENKIAIIGMALRFPDADNPGDFWQNLRTGKESIHRFSDKELLQSGISKETIEDPKYVKASATVEDIDKFDYRFFDMTRIEAENTDVQSRVFLQCAWHALEDACIHLGKSNNHIGVFAGAGFNMYLYQNLFTYQNDLSTAELFQILFTNEKEFLVTNTAYRLNLKGPVINIQSACSTSLVAVHYACQSLLNGECDVALAGGSSLYVPIKAGYLAHEGTIFSPDGRCRPFDADANGTVPGNGCGVVVLKRLEDAIYEQDHIYTTIRGSAVANDGSEKMAFTAPGINGQVRVIKEALMVSATHPDNVRYIETHGTGTRLGDPIEVSALQQTYGQVLSPQNEIVLGSVKSNLGHLNAAAGVAGLIKAALVLYHQQVPPTLYFKRANPEIGLETLPFTVNNSLLPLQNNNVSSCAAVSSFGIGGTNAHVILESAPDRDIVENKRNQDFLIPFSAKSEQSLREQLENHSDFLHRVQPNLDSYTKVMSEYRSRFDKRAFIIADSLDKATKNLQSRYTVMKAKKDHKIIFLFPGQGSQYPGMCRQLYRQFATVKKQVDLCLDFLLKEFNLDYRDLLLGENVDLPVNNAATAQIILYITERAIARLLIEMGVAPAVVCGHSIGEYAAASVSGVFSCCDGLTMLVERGRLLEPLPKSKMHLVLETEQCVKKLLEDHIDGQHSIEIATINSPHATVVAGSPAEIQAFSHWLKTKKITSIAIKTDKAFHSSHVAGIEKDYKNIVKNIEFKNPSLSITSGVLATIVQAEQITNADYWVSQTIQSINFQKTIQSIRTTYPDQYLIFVECGPGSSLCSFIKKILGRKDTYLTMQTCSGKHTLRDQTIYQAVGQLWQMGLDINWQTINGSGGLTIPVPGYAFEKCTCWKKPVKPAKEQDRESIKKDEPQLFTPVWEEHLVQEREEDKSALLVFDLPTRAISKLLRKKGYEPLTILQGPPRANQGDIYYINPEEESDFENFCSTLSHQISGPFTLVYGWSATNDNMNNHFMYPVKLLRNLCKNEKRNARFVAVTGQAFNVLGDETVNVRSSMLLGVLLAMPYEYPGLSFTLVDLPHSLNKNDVNSSELFLRAFKSECNNNLQAIRGNKIWTRKNIRFSSKSKWDSPLLSKKGTVLITGGLGNLGLFLAEYLSERFQANIILTRKHFFPEREKWENYIQKNPNSQNAKIIQKLKYLEDQHGSKILTFQALVDNEIEMNKLVKTCEAKLGKIDGVIHAAGLTKMTAMKTIEKIDETTLEQHLRPKLDGAKTLASLEYNQRPDFFLFTSSLSVFVGGFGLGAYVAANACMDTLTGQLALAGERVLSINFNGLDLHPNNKGIDLMAKNGDFLSNTDAKKMFSIFFTTKLDQVIVSRHVPNINTLLTDREINIHTNRSTNVTRKDLVIAKTDLERQIIRLFEDLLGSSPIGMTDNFFELGGNSLVAAQLNARISSNLNIELPLDRVLSNPTPEGICTVILEDKLAKNNLPENILEILETLSEDEAKKYLENLKNE